MVLKGLDIQMVAFVGVSLLQEYVSTKQLPRLYYWDQQFSDSNKKIA